MTLRKVAYPTPLYFDDESCIGGGERYPLNLGLGVAAASKGSVDVELISYGPRAFRRQLGEGVTLRVLKAAHQPSNPLDAVSWEIVDAIAEADLVHIHMVYTRSNEAALLVAKQLGKPLVMTDHGGLSSNIGLCLDSLELADHIVAYSDFGASLHQTRSPITVIKGGVNGTHFQPPSAGSPRKRDRVLYVGRLLSHKGIDRLIEAMPEDLPLTVCGRPYDPAYFQHLKALAKGKRVEFVTDADDRTILELYRRAWANVLPSVYRDCYGNHFHAPELMGFTLLEAMACGTPAICNLVAAMPEFVEHGVTGFVFDSIDELREQLLTLATDPTKVEAMGTAARRAIDEEFDLRVAGRKMLALYHQLVADRARAAA